MAAFLVAICWVCFDDSDLRTRIVLSTLLGLLFFTVLVVMVVEGAANTIRGTLRHRVCSAIVEMLQISYKA